MSTRTTLLEWCSVQTAADQWSLSDCRMERKKVKRSATTFAKRGRLTISASATRFQLHLLIVQLSDKRKVLEELQKIEDVQNPVYRAKGEIMSLTDKVSQMAKKREQLYADYVAGVVDSEDYQLIREDYSRQYDGLRAALQEAENKKVQVEQQIEEYLNMTSHLEEHLDNFEFDIQLVKSLVQKIEVSADKRIRIVFGFRDVFTELGKESAET